MVNLVTANHPPPIYCTMQGEDESKNSGCEVVSILAKHLSCRGKNNLSEPG